MGGGESKSKVSQETIQEITELLQTNFDITTQDIQEICNDQRLYSKLEQAYNAAINAAFEAYQEVNKSSTVDGKASIDIDQDTIVNITGSHGVNINLKKYVKVSVSSAVAAEVSAINNVDMNIDVKAISADMLQLANSQTAANDTSQDFSTLVSLLADQQNRAKLENIQTTQQTQDTTKDASMWAGLLKPITGGNKTYSSSASKTKVDSKTLTNFDIDQIKKSLTQNNVQQTAINSYLKNISQNFSNIVRSISNLSDNVSSSMAIRISQKSNINISNSFDVRIAENKIVEAAQQMCVGYASYIGQILEATNKVYTENDTQALIQLAQDTVSNNLQAASSDTGASSTQSNDNSTASRQDSQQTQVKMTTMVISVVVGLCVIAFAITKMMRKNKKEEMQMMMQMMQIQQQQPKPMSGGYISSDFVTY